MSGVESRHPNDWLEKACRDLRRVDVLLDVDDAEGAGFHLQQAVEKALKALLLSQGILPRRIRDLVALLNEAVSYMPGLESFRELCEVATGFYIPQRYPFLSVSPPDREELEEWLNQAKELVHAVGAATGFKPPHSLSSGGL